MRISTLVASVADPPVAQAKQWIAGRTFGPDRPLVDVSQAVPSYPPAAALRAHLAEVVQRDDTATYAPAHGLPATRDAIATHFRRAYRGSVNEAHVLVTAGCNQAYCLAIGALCAPGDEVILPVPYYFNHHMWLVANDVVPTLVHASPDDGMVPSIDAIAAAITPRTRAIVLVTPNNPCGVVYPPETIEAVYGLARAADVALVLDETYKDFRATTAPPHSLFARDDWPSTLVHLFSFSKVFSLAGYRCGSLVADPELLRQAVKLADCETIGAPRIAQEAVTYGLTHLGDWAEARRLEMVERVEQFRAALGDGASGYDVVSAGAYFAYVRHPFERESATTVAKRLADDHDLLAIPGECFGPHQDRFVRMAFGNVDAAHMGLVAQRLAESRAHE